MKKNLLLILFALSSLTAVNAQIECNENLLVDLGPDGETEVPVTDFVANIEFMLTQGIVTYYLWPGTTGVIESSDDMITVDCSNANLPSYIFEVTDQGNLLFNCVSEFAVIPGGDCGNSVVFCEDMTDCSNIQSVFIAGPNPPEEIDATAFAACYDESFCQMENQYSVAYGHGGNLSFTSSLPTSGLVDFQNPVSVLYSDESSTVVTQTYLYYWDFSDCIFIGINSVNVPLDVDGKARLTPDMFLYDADNTCSSVKLAVVNEGDPDPVDFKDFWDVDCDDLGSKNVWIRNEDNGNIIISGAVIIDPLEACGSILGPGDKLINFLNDAPFGTTSDTEIKLNGEILPQHPGLIGWIINEDQLIDGENRLDFDNSPLKLNGVSTLDLVLGQRIILNDLYDDPIESVVFDIDQSGYNGINDMIKMRQIILGANDGSEFQDVYFVHEDYEFPSDFNPFDFENNFTEFLFNSSDYEATGFSFETHKVGDVNGSAVSEFNSDKNASTKRSEGGAFAVTDMTVMEGEEFTFEYKFESETKIVGLLTALIGDGVEFLELTSDYPAEVVYNINNGNDIRISYIAANLTPTLNSISFEIRAKSSKSGKLIDLLGLKTGFPQEVVDENNETEDIDDLISIIVVSLDENQKLDIQLYPNPVTDQLVLSSGDLTIQEVSIVDMSGNLVYYNTRNTPSIDVSQWASGLYVLRVSTDAGVENVRFVKE